MCASTEEESAEDADTVVQIIFQKNRTESVDFEVALNALLATGVFTTISGETNYRVIVSAIAGLLLTVTVVRRMAITGRFARQESIISKTQPLIEFLSVISIFQILNHILRYVAEGLGYTIESLIPISLTAIILFVVFIGFHQLLFRDYFLYWGAFFFTYSITFAEAVEEEEGLTNLLLSTMASNAFAQIAYMGLKNNIPDDNSEEVRELQQFVSNVERQETEGSSDSAAGIMLVGGLFLLIAFGPAILVLDFFLANTVEIILLFITAYILKHMIEFLYLGYGVPIQKEPRRIKWQVVGTAFYVVVVIFLFS